MKRPPAATMFFGHPAIVLAMGGAFLWVAYLWLRGEAGGAGALALLVAAVACAKANDRRQHYRQWKREWDIMGGKLPVGRISFATLKVGIAILCWVAMAVAALEWMDDPDRRWLAVLFWCATGLGLLNRLLQWRKSRKPARLREAPVSLCLRAPLRSPSLADARAALPDYCRTLLTPR